MFGDGDFIDSSEETATVLFSMLPVEHEAGVEFVVVLGFVQFACKEQPGIDISTIAVPVPEIVEALLQKENLLDGVRIAGIILRGEAAWDSVPGTAVTN